MERCCLLGDGDCHIGWMEDGGDWCHVCNKKEPTGFICHMTQSTTDTCVPL